MSIRSYDPSKVKREHIRPKTLVYGTDKPGIILRMKRFEEILDESGEHPSVFPNASAAIGYLSSGDMFSDSICVVIYDASDMLRSDTSAKQLYSAFMRALATYDDSSAIVIGAASSNASMKKMAADIEGLGGMAREVEAPRQSDFMLWLSEYAKSADIKLSDRAKETVASASGENPESAVSILSVLGAEVEHLSESDIKAWLESDEEATGSDIRSYIETRDVPALMRLRESFPPTPQGYRTYLVRLRHNLIDILIATNSNGNVDPLYSFKASQYGNGNSAYFVMREPVGRDLTPYYSRLYQEINYQIESMAKSGSGDIKHLMSVVTSAGR